jgi:flagellar capping protein FliD
MTLSDGVYYIGSGNAYGLSVTSDSTSVSTTIHIGTSLLGKLNDYFDEMLGFGNDIDTTITQYNEQISDYQDDLTNFDRQIENLRAQYVAQFASMDAAVASLDQTKELLNGFMDSWKASLK